MIDATYTEELELIATLADEFGESVNEEMVDGLLFGSARRFAPNTSNPKKGAVAEQAPESARCQAWRRTIV